MKRWPYLLLESALCLRCALAQSSASPPVVPPPPPAASSAAPLLAIEPHVRDEKDGKRAATQVHLAPRFATTIRMRDAVRSVVVGDASKFRAERKDGDDSLVVVKVTTEEPAQTNLEITTVTGQQAILWLISDPRPLAPVDFALHYDAPASTAGPGSFWRQESAMPNMLIAETKRVGEAEPVADPAAPNVASSATPTPVSLKEDLPRVPMDGQDPKLGQYMAEQAKAPLPVLYGQHPGAIPGGPHLEAGVSRVVDQGGTVLVMFSVLNPAKDAVALLPPQVQLGGQVKKKWTTAEQLPVLAYRLDRLRLGPGERANGVLVFERPSFKQSTESLFLQMADAGAIDEPVLAPIGFGVSSQKEGQVHAGFSDQSQRGPANR